MPGGDRTGPLGQGAMSGRGTGLCRGNDVPGSASSAGFARAMGRRSGCGMGRGTRKGNFINPEFFADNSETASLKETVEELKNKIDKLTEK